MASRQAGKQASQKQVLTHSPHRESMTYNRFIKEIKKKERKKDRKKSL